MNLAYNDIIILDQWFIIDKWWTDSPIRSDYVLVSFMGPEIMFKRISDDLVWRIVKYE